MKRIISLLLLCAFCSSQTLFAEESSSPSYQSYSYCAECNNSPCQCEGEESTEEIKIEELPVEVKPEQFPCDPCAPICAPKCGISVWAVGVATAAIGVLVAIVLASSNGGNSN